MMANNVMQSFKWVFLTTIFRRVLSFLLFLYIVNIFSRAELGIYRAFALIISFGSIIGVFGFNVLNIVEKSKKYFFHGLQFALFSSIIVSLLLFIFRRFLSEKYNSFDLYLYISYGFWLVIPMTIKKMIRSLYELNMNFKFLSIVETINLVSYTIFVFLLFLIDLKFYFFVLAFYMGELVELGILYYSFRNDLNSKLYDILHFKFLPTLKTVFKENFMFLSLTTIPTALNMFVAEAPILLMGWFYLPDFIGNYFVAAQLVTVPISFLTISLCQVLFPAFSLTDKADLSKKVKEYLTHAVLLLWVPILVLGILLKNYSHFIIGKQEISIVNSIIVALAIKTLFVVILNPLSTIPTVLKKPQYELYWSIFNMLGTCIVIYFSRGFEFINMVFLYVSFSSLCLILFILMIMKMVKLEWKCFFSLIARGLIYVLPLLAMLFFSFENILTGMFILAMGIIYAIGLLYFSEKDFFQKLKKRL